MAIAKVQKAQLLVHSDKKMEILSSLQEAGLVQIEKASFEDVELIFSSPDVSEFDHRLHRISHALTSLSRWEERGLIKKIFSQRPQLCREARKEVLSFNYLSILEKIEKLEAEKNEILSELKFLDKEIELLVPLKSLELPLSSVKPTDYTDIIIGILPSSRYETFQDRMGSENVWYEVINRGKRFLYILILYLKKEKNHIEETFKELNFAQLYFTEPILCRAEEQDKAEIIIDKIIKEMETKKGALDSLEKQAQQLFIHREKLMLIYDVLLNEREKILSSSLLGETKSVSYMEGWIRSRDIGIVKNKLKAYSDVFELYFRPPLPEEDPPVILENLRIGKPFEVVTKLYGFPQHGSFDPTLSLAPFFFIFVGLCISEAGYGLLATVLSLLYIKLAKPKGGLLQFLKLLSMLGISTVIFGTLVGGWFGFPIRSLMVLDPLQDPLSFLKLSLALGFVQVWFGTLLNMISGIKNKRYMQPIFVQGGWLILLPSLVLYMLTKNFSWGILSLCGASGIVFFASPSRNLLGRFFGGLYSLYDISRYLADVLSYSRLLALGLATSVIAMVVNTLCQTALGIPWLGWLLAALIFIGGHLFNLAISFLGGFVHSMRLQFVEFFSKFFKSGGKPFEPFELETKFVEFI